MIMLFCSLQGICLENGILVAFYNNGVLCWNAKTGHLVLDETNEDGNTFTPSGKNVIMFQNEEVQVRHALEYIFSITTEAE